MPDIRRPFTKKKALALVLGTAALLLILILLRLLLPAAPEYDLSTREGREAFLLELGWEIDRESEVFRSVTVPDKLEGIMLQYNKMQLTQGYDLSQHLGEKCGQYTYTLTNYADSEGTVVVTLYIQGKTIIAGDIHTTAANGFMHALRRNDAN